MKKIIAFAFLFIGVNAYCCNSQCQCRCHHPQTISNVQYIKCNDCGRTYRYQQKVEPPENPYVYRGSNGLAQFNTTTDFHGYKHGNYRFRGGRRGHHSGRRVRVHYR